jgi:single-strand DNA-binding protein
MLNAFFTGNLGRNAEVRQTQGGTSVCNFPVATKVGYGEREQTIWLDCAIFGKRAEGKLPEILTKGQQVAVMGELSTREHEGKTYLNCKVSELDLVGGKPQGESQGDAQNRSTPPSDGLDDSIPFAPLRGAWLLA